jgi:hypothetical protein
MGETKTKNDPPEFKVDARLKQIKAELSKDDYNVVMAIVRENIKEKGDFELDAERPLPVGTDKSEMNLPLKKRHKSGSTSSRYLKAIFRCRHGQGASLEIESFLTLFQNFVISLGFLRFLGVH